MVVKRLLLTIILCSFLVSFLPNDFLLYSERVNRLVDFYGKIVATKTPISILYNPGVRVLPVKGELNISVVLPEAKDFPCLLDTFLAGEGQVLLQCSSLDSWHCTELGNNYLQKIRKKAYRIVIFDGGHHLPTLGLEPDIIILPIWNDYAVHGYMLDGIKVEKILSIIQELNAPIVVASVPRWGLVKQDMNLSSITTRVLEKAKVSSRKDNFFSPISQAKMSKYQGTVLAYIDKSYSKDLNAFYTNMDKLGLAGVATIYLAFDYNWIDVKKAEQYAENVRKNTNINVEIVNEPVKVSNSLWGA